MQTFRANLNNCTEVIRSHPEAAVVVIDVLRAYTTAAYLFDAGAAQIVLVSTIWEAVAWRSKDPDCLLLGEVNGVPVAGFDLGNAPAHIHAAGQLRGRRVVQRTSSGTQGAVRAANALAKPPAIFCCGLTNAGATARAVAAGGWQSAMLIETGVQPDKPGDEDVACADYLSMLLERDAPAVTPVELDARVRASQAGRLFDGSRHIFPPEDLDLATAVDRFDFVMPVRVNQAGLFLEKKA